MSWIDKVTFTVIDSEPDDYEPPRYGTRGRILFRMKRYVQSEPEVEVLDYDGNSSIFWLEEGMGIEYYLKNEMNALDLPDGNYLVAGYGVYIRGMDWRQSPEPYDDDEEWYFNMVPIPTKMETLGEAPWTSRS